MSKLAKWIGALGGLLILGGIVWGVWQRDTPNVFYVPRAAIPPAAKAIIGHSNGTVRAFFGPLHALLILPDGSLWEWGGLGGPSGKKIRVPTRIGTNHDWTEAAVADGHYLGIRRDGTLWNWGTPYSLSPLMGSSGPVTFPVSPAPAGSESNCVRIAASRTHSVILRRDGTIWAWGDDSLGQMGNGLGSHETNRVAGPGFVVENDNLKRVQVHEGRTNLVQVGTNNDWTAISGGYGPSTFGLRRDGTLWVWGAITIWGITTQIVYSVPTQVCREEDWVHIDGQIALNSKGEAWRLLRGRPEPAAPAASNCDLLAGGCVPGRGAFGAFEICQLHHDGTMWGGKVKWSPKEHRLGPVTTWRRIGKRSDWISLDGWMGTVIGVTADGTVWTWGTDLSQDGVEMFQSRMGAMKRQVLGLLRAGPASGSSASVMPEQKEPRELFRLIFKMNDAANP